MYKSIVEYFADKSGSRCGYCRSRDQSFSHGMWGHVLTCSDYQDLIDRGWRRSGRYCYKPTMDKTCCPQYTIKCDATHFQLTKSQKKVLKKFRNFVMKGENPPMTNLTSASSIDPNRSDSEPESESESEEDEKDAMDVESTTQAKAEQAEKELRLDPNSAKLSMVETKTTLKDDIDSATDTKEESTKSNLAHVNVNVKPGLGADPSKPKARKKKELRKEKALAKLKASGKTDLIPKKAKNEVKTLEDLTTDEFPSDSKHKFEIRLVSAQTSDAKFNESYIDSYNVYKKYQMAIHKDSPSKCTIGQFKRFLCNASLVHSDSRYGAFHQQYVIDGKIIAVGVIDILPNCVSSVYLYYDPDYAFLSPGTLTSLFEIAFTRKLQQERPHLKHYYMGYYIHSCPKMRYKAKYYPSWLLCPKTYRWEPVKNSLLLLDKSKYSILHPGGADNAEHPIKIDESVVLFEHQAMTFGLYRTLNSVDDSELSEVQEYIELVGSNLSKKILLYRG